MKLMCSRSRGESREFDHCEFAVIKADRKYVMGITPAGEEWFLPHRSSVKAVAVNAPDLMQVSKSVLVSPGHVLGMTGNSKSRVLHTGVGDYRFSREVPVQPFVSAARANAQARELARNAK